MIQKRWIRGAVLSGVLVLPILTAGCGLFSQETSKSIDPPQIEVKDGTEGAETGQAVVGEENANDRLSGRSQWLLGADLSSNHAWR